MVVITPAADGVPPRVEEEIIVLLFLAARLKRRAAEEKKARVVVGVVLVFVSKDDDDAFVLGDVKVSAGDGADERRSPTALCIFLSRLLKNCRVFLYRAKKLTFF